MHMFLHKGIRQHAAGPYLASLMLKKDWIYSEQTKGAESNINTVLQQNKAISHNKGGVQPQILLIQRDLINL